jgi:hypothetical protein
MVGGWFHYSQTFRDVWTQTVLMLPTKKPSVNAITGTIDSQIRLGIDDDPCVVRGCPTRR